MYGLKNEIGIVKKNLIYLFLDQLSFEVSSLKRMNKSTDIVMMCELDEQMCQVPHHQQKIAYWLSTMRHFAEKLRMAGIQVHYVALEDADNTHTITGELLRAKALFSPDAIIIADSSEWHWQEKINQLIKNHSLPVEWLSDDRFFCEKSEFFSWAKGKKKLLMEYFYREMRKKHRILVDEKGKPVGGEWNYDKQNRQPPKSTISSPPRLSHKKSTIIKESIALVKKRYNHHFGHLNRFYYAVTSEQAMLELNHFIEKLLPHFGEYQDIMQYNEAYLYHSLLSSYINSGLLLPRQVCAAAVKAFQQGKIPLNSAEGFIRQILGWREYIRGIYWMYMPQYAASNTLHATRALPAFYWSGKTQMRCLSNVVQQTMDHAYSHHIQRLMVTGNFALLSGINVNAVHEWYLAVYADAYEWVEMPNTIGMALFADGGIVASKPYAASGAYIQRMSNFCKGCAFNVKEAIGEKACPFNSLYWSFLNRHRSLFQVNPRMTYMYATWDKFSTEKQTAILNKAQYYLQLLEKNKL